MVSLFKTNPPSIQDRILAADLAATIDLALTANDKKEESAMIKEALDLVPEVDDNALCIRATLVASYLTRHQEYKWSDYGHDKASHDWSMLVSLNNKHRKADCVATVLAYLHRFTIPITYAAYKLIGIDAIGHHAENIPSEGDENDRKLEQAIDQSFRAYENTPEEDNALAKVLRLIPHAKDRILRLDASVVASHLTRKEPDSPEHKMAVYYWWQNLFPLHCPPHKEALTEQIDHMQRCVLNPKSPAMNLIRFLRKEKHTFSLNE